MLLPLSAGVPWNAGRAKVDQLGLSSHTDLKQRVMMEEEEEEKEME